MTTITIERELLEQFLAVLTKSSCAVGYESETEWLNVVKELRAALAAPATATEKCGHCGRRTIDPPWPVRTAPTTDERHAQELLDQDITLQNMAERHAQELLAYQIKVDKLLVERRPMTFAEKKLAFLELDSEASYKDFIDGIDAAEAFHGIGDKT